jgi:hypothetical protein
MLTGALSKLTSLFRNYTGVLSFAGTVTGVLSTAAGAAVASVITYGGVLSRLLQLNRTYNGVLTLSGAISRSLVLSRTYAGISFAGSVTASIGGIFQSSLSSEISFSGALTRQAFFFRILTSGITPTAPDIGGGGQTMSFGEIFMDMTLEN